MKYHHILIFILLFTQGCASIGPKTIPGDRFDYNTSISDSWKEQTLLNIVKLRYADMPLFVEVASIVSGYSMESSVNLGSNFSSLNNASSEAFSLGGSGKFTDRPTITYAPITGQRFNLSFMQPIPPSVVLFLIQTGWPADLILNITLDSVNGLRSQVSGGANMRTGDPEFYRYIELLRKVQKSGAVGMKIIKDKDMKESTIMFFYEKHITSEIRAVLEEIAALLDLKPGIREVKVTYGSVSENDEEICMITRSMMQIMMELAGEVDVPELHSAEGRVAPALQRDLENDQKYSSLLHIKTATEKPDNAFSAVRYRDNWFWIDDRDFQSKRIFSFIMLLFSLTETGGKEGLPIVTIPAG